MNFPEAQTEEAERPRAASLKFTHPSGARPLEGYTIKRGVGRGGFGEVYFATSDAGKEVALKLIRRNLDVELRGVTQCLNLKHPNLIALYDIRTDEMGDQWVIMEYVSGESLEDIIDRNPNGMPVEEAMWWMRGVCGGVAYLHDHGIVHRDLKPGNIFSDEGTVKIGDYGLAKFISCSRRSGQTESVGTVHYMAPEIANGRYGREIDTYALGIILFEMLTGRVPFEGESVGEVLMKHLTAEPDLSTLEEPFRGIVQRALAKDPNVRIDTVSELVALLPGASEEVVLTPIVRPAPTTNAPAAAAAPSAAPFSPAVARRDAYAAAQRGWSHAVNRMLPNADAPIEEPIWKAIRNGADFVRRRWHGEGVKPLPWFQKALLVLALVFAVLWFSQDAFGIGIQVLIVYCIYYVVWTSFIQPSARRRAQESASISRGAAVHGTDQRANEHTAAWPTDAEVKAAAKPTSLRRPVRPSWRERAHQQLAAKSLRERISEMIGSMLLAAVFAAIAACVGPLVSSQQPDSENFALYLWLATVGTIGSWAVIVPSKLAEGRIEDQVPMRLTLLLLGALVGVAAWFFANILLLDVPTWGDPVSIDRGLLSNEMLKWPMLGTGMRLSPAYFIAYFAFLFLLPRWWRQTEFTRNGRMSLWWVLVCVGWAWLLHFFWWFPQPAGMMVAGVIAIATQLSSPWMPPSRRKALAAEIEGGVV
ncbi:MAG: serine/threonine protein kinase [Planctomycetes bacterium]|nr:serine/threonine protein kinase [Planctomycetota bacterium]